MDILLFVQAVFLGIVEGLTEFLPVSSTGHLILMIDLIGFEGPPGKIFEIVIQLGAILAVCWVYREKLIHSVLSMHKEKASRNFVRNIILAFIPSVVLGVFAYSFIKEVLFSPLVVSVSLIIGGIIIILIERKDFPPEHTNIDEFSPKLAFYIGLCQTISMIPGTSRAGATIMGAMLLGVERKTAAEFSFFLAIPTMLGATAYDIYKNFDSLDNGNILVIAVGFISAFFAALVVIRTMIGFISVHGFSPFGWYRIVIGTIMLGILFFPF